MQDDLPTSQLHFEKSWWLRSLATLRLLLKNMRPPPASSAAVLPQMRYFGAKSHRSAPNAEFHFVSLNFAGVQTMLR